MIQCCGKEDIQKEETLYNSYILFNDHYYQLKDTCYYSTPLGAFIIDIRSPRTANDASSVQLVCYGNLFSGDSSQGYRYGDYDDKIWNSFTNYSYIGLSSSVNQDEIGYWLTGGTVRINQMIDEWEIIMNCIFEYGDSVFVKFKGYPYSVDH